MAADRSPCCRHPVTAAGSVGSPTPETPSPSRYTCCLWIRSEPSETPMSTQRDLLWSPDLGSSLHLAPPLSTNTRGSTVCLSIASPPGPSTHRPTLLRGPLCPGPSAQSARGLAAVLGQVPAAFPLNRGSWDHPSPRGLLLMG